MSNTEQSINLIELVKAIGPYFVSVAGMLFAFIQSKRLAEITKEKDLEIAKLQKQSVISMENLKSKSVAILKLQEIYSPLFAKVTAILNSYCGIVSGKKNSEEIKAELGGCFADDYCSLTFESRKVVLAEAIAICQSLKDHKCYELAVELDNKTTEALALVDTSGTCSGKEHVESIYKALRELSLLYVAFFYRLANFETAANSSSNADAASTAVS
ncbi:hypothetical protein [uncultured Pseudoalteromonas sp.]|uniref:hypothetical protein n=1 Tax=uncultured Pseudoalteromonas sp. TaxID=114053 RepID=UPI0032B25F14|tara:strand:- start:46080 stop:46724 length:645 start_codon:yes stop_codon:yes gene_type:complete